MLVHPDCVSMSAAHVNASKRTYYTNSVSDQHRIHSGGQHTLVFCTKCVMTDRQALMYAETRYTALEMEEMGLLDGRAV